MLKLYFHTAPNPMKVALFLEEAALPYETVPIDTRKGEQHTPEFLAINPNGKTPALVDGDVTVFDSTAILLYLAEKTGKFGGPATLAARGELLSWLLFLASGVGPFSGQAVHFKHFAPAENVYAKQRYDFEARRHYQILDERLATRTYLSGDAYTIADMSLWGWARAVPRVVGPDAWQQFPNVKRWLDGVSARPAAVRAEELTKKYTFKTEVDEDARRHMFRHLAVPTAKNDA
jgi:GST-like protein